MFGLKRESKGKKYIEEKYGVSTPVLQAYDSGYDFLYSVKDLVTVEFNPPFVCKNDKLAVRTLKDSLKGRATLLTEYPDDYELYCLGTFDSVNGIVSSNVHLVTKIVDIVNNLNKENLSNEIQK